MCGSSNPFSDDAAVKWMCAACTYHNPEGASRCAMCGLELVVRRRAVSPQHSPDACWHGALSHVVRVFVLAPCVGATLSGFV